MRLLNTTLLGIAFIGLVGCENSTTDSTTMITYKGAHYMISSFEDRTSMGVAGSSIDLYVCEYGRWRLVKYQVEKNIDLISKYGKTTFQYNSAPHKSGAVIVPERCTPPPKQPKKDKTKVHTGNTIAPEITGTDGFEGGD